MKRSVWRLEAGIFVCSKEYYTIKEATISGEGVYTRVRRAQYYEKLTMVQEGMLRPGKYGKQVCGGQLHKGTRTNNARSVTSASGWANSPNVLGCLTKLFFRSSHSRNGLWISRTFQVGRDLHRKSVLYCHHRLLHQVS